MRRILTLFISSCLSKSVLLDDKNGYIIESEGRKQWKLTDIGALSIVPYLLPNCDTPIKLFTRSDSTSQWELRAQMCDSRSSTDYDVKWVAKSTSSVFIYYEGSAYIKLALCLEPDGSCFYEHTDPAADDAFEESYAPNYEEIYACLTICNNATLESGYCEMMCQTSPKDVLLDLKAVNQAPFLTNPGQDVGVIDAKNCFASCKTKYWYVTYCNYMCFGSFHGPPVQTTTTTTTTTSTTTRKRYVPNYFFRTTKAPSVARTVAPTATATNGQCGYSAALSTLHISEKDDNTDYTIEIKISTDDDQKTENSTSDIYVDLNITSIVVNGKDVTVEGKYPWLVALRTNGGHHYCGGVILNKNWILTAAHCEFSTFGDRIIIGAHYRSNRGTETITKVVQNVKHPRGALTQSGTWDYDFRLLKVEQPITFGAKAFPICLPQPGQDFTGQNCWLAGWGRTRAQPREYATVLQETDTTINSHCGNYQSLVTPVSFCAGYNGHSSGCNGDSGGPLICQGSDGNYIVVGVASWAATTCSTSTPTGFAKVSSVMPWIHQTIR